MQINEIIKYVINLIYPNVCGICDKLCDDDICKKCEIKLNNISKIKIDRYTNKYFKKHLYIFKYDGIIKERLIKYKFNERNYIYKAFVKFMLKNKKICDFLKNYDIIIPVPIHTKRRMERGYNQSALIAKAISKKIPQIDYLEDVIIKKINNKPQSTKSKFERKNNVIGAYYLKNKEKINNKKILLLDDIYTTGNTVNECCKILQGASPKCIDVITIAKD